MKRVFIQHDEKGDIIATAVVEEMHADLNHPFLLSDPAHGAVELDADDPLLQGDRAALHETHMVDVKAKKLVPRQQTTSRKPRKPGST